LKPLFIDNRRRLLIPGSAEQTLAYALADWIKTAQEAIAKKGSFFVALSGGSTPKALFTELSKNYASALDWSKVWLFWSDERQVLPTDPESNFHMAMIESHLSDLSIDAHHIFRMPAEKEIEANAQNYEKSIRSVLPEGQFDLIMLGMGEDGHVASLFPGTLALTAKNRWVVANYVTQKQLWRMTFTFDLINRAKKIAIYVIGSSKAKMAHTLLMTEDKAQAYPAFYVGTPESPCNWILDESAASLIKKELNS
jgi:6-phosphogluconolactonase